MTIDFNSLSDLRAYWQRRGHKNVPHLHCSCFYVDKNGKVIPCIIHPGFHWKVILFLIRLFFYIRLEKAARLMEAYKNKTGNYNALEQ